MKQRMILPVNRQMYYYIYAANYRGRPFFDGPLPHCHSKEEARKIAFRRLKGVVWEIVESPYRDPSRVQGNMRHNTLMETGDPDQALQRMRHQV